MKRLVWIIAAIVLIAGGNIVNGRITDYWQDIVQQCLIAAIMAVSLNIVNGLTGQFAIGHAGFMAVGAYTGASVTYLALAHVAHTSQANMLFMFIAMAAGGALAAVFGWLVGVPSLRLRGDYLAIVTLGFGEIIRVVLENTHEISSSLDFMGGATGFQNVPSLTNFPLLMAIVLLVIVVALNLKFSAHGLAFMSIREDEIAADAMGVDTTRIKVSAFVLSAFFAGVGGVLFAHAKFFKPDVFGFIMSMNYVVMIVLGGTGSISGAVIGAAGLTLLPELLKLTRDVVRARMHIDVNFTDEYLQVIYALILVLMMILRPAGIFGKGEFSLAWFARLWRRPQDVVQPAAEESAPRSELAAPAAPVQTPGRVLNAVSLTKQFGGLTAVGDVNLRLDRGELVGLIGPNGAGKTTVFNLLTGVYEPTQGSLEFNGAPLAGERPNLPTVRALLLAWDAVVATFGGFVVGTILATSLLPAAMNASERGLQVVIRWGVTLIFAAASFITAPRRRRTKLGLKPYQFAQRGISRTFQNIRLFGELTVLENVRIGTYLRRRTGLFDAFLHTPRLKREEAETTAKARALLKRFNLLRLQDERARNLPYGDQRRLEIVRALATDPQLLLLDEPAAGMNPHEKAELMALIRTIRDDFGLTILLIEHDMKLVMGICERVYVLDYGKIIAEGTPAEVRRNAKVVAAYLGEETDESSEETRAPANPAELAGE
ncbi:MAG TPA: branched-chain amino acid ABC transporter ATP-binding protein/permease, partial [Chthonomonadaceae bacterium]|nr:branched-chain amino acid ABC transporter ATP-binding protein/permease [Chthonomonadaceae bacterium]